MEAEASTQETDTTTQNEASKEAAAKEANAPETQASDENVDVIPQDDNIMVADLDDTSNKATATTYLDYNAETGKFEQKSVEGAASITAQTEALDESESKWYVVDSDVSIGDEFGIPVNGDVHLILADGKKLEVPGGLRVNDGNSLTIYAQSTDADAMGALTMPGKMDNGSSGIGAGSFKTLGNVTINGGKITANGGRYGGPGIGSTSDFYQGGSVTIHGGIIEATATAMGASGISVSGGTLTITGGTVIASGEGILNSGTGISATLSTETSGHAFIIAKGARSAISDTTNKDGWSGVIIEGTSGQVYGKNVTLDMDATIPEGTSVDIPSGTTLSLSDGASLTNNGSIYVDGTLDFDVANDSTGSVYYPLTTKYATAAAVSNHNEKTYAKQGDTVTLTPAKTPAGYTFDKWVVTDASGKEADDVKISDTNTFTMPKKAVTVTATYKGSPEDIVYTVNATDEEKQDGKLVDVSDQMEYAKVDPANPDELNYIEVPAGETEVSGLGAGTYKVRYKATDNYPASDDVTLTISVGQQTIQTTISVDGNSWTQFSSNVTFGCFFKEAKNVTIEAVNKYGTATDLTVEYYLSEKALSKAETQQDSIKWIPYKEAFSIAPNSKQFIYAKVTDKDENVMIANSKGIVIYTDSTAQESSLEYTKGVSTNDLTSTIALNGNTIKDITVTSKDGKTSTLTKDTDYTITTDEKKETATITWKSTYLKELTAGDYTFTTTYNPLGETYSDATGNEAPKTTTASLTVRNAKLISVTAPQNIEGLENGTKKTADALGLPKTVAIQTENSQATTADVVWDLDNLADGTTYDPESLEAQTFAINGTVQLPDGIDQNGVSLDVKIQISVKESPKNVQTKYLDYNEETGKLEQKVVRGAAIVSSNTTTLDDSESGKWYVVNGDITIDDRVKVDGNVYLILADGAQLQASKGINVSEGNSLTIYAQSTDEATMGQLIAAGSGMAIYSGIGSSNTENVGTITINGGKVTAIGGALGGNGIGGALKDDAGSITIHGGIVKATAENLFYSGIGVSAKYGEIGGTVTITGGTVTATGGSLANGIKASTFSTGKSGNAFVIATGGIDDISDKTNKNIWSGVIIEDRSGRVYGEAIELGTNATIPEGTIVELPFGTTLSLAKDVSLVNNGAIYVDGTLDLDVEKKSTGSIWYPITVKNATAFALSTHYKKTYAKETDTIALTPNETPTGYTLDRWLITDAAGKEAGDVKVSDTNTFTMPGKALTVTAIFAGSPAKVVSAVDETVKGKKDGQLTGLSDAMEYAKVDPSNPNELTYVEIPAGTTELTGLEAGTYKVRYKATDNYPASDAATLTISSGEQLNVKSTDSVSSAISANPKKVDYNGSTTVTVAISNGYEVMKDFKLVATYKDGDGKEQQATYSDGVQSSASPLQYTFTIKNIQTDMTLSVEGVKAVTPVEETKVKVSPTSVTLTSVGQTKKLKATVTPSSAANKKVTWKSSNKKVATVDANGKVTAIGDGTATITATLKNGTAKATCKVKVSTSTTKRNNKLAMSAKFKASSTGKKVKVSWGKVSGADGYYVYAQYCGKDFSATPTTTVKSNATTSVTITKINKKAIDTKKVYKICVVAYKTVNGKNIAIGKSICGHVAGSQNTKYTNPNKVTTTKSSYSLKAGKTAQIKANQTLVNKKKKALTDSHATIFRYASSDKSVATVNWTTGKITAVAKGTCKVYVYARNGYTKTISVTVK